MTFAARKKAARCFALASSTTFPAERETAIERGKAICEANDLDLDDFDIPGRTPTKSRAPESDIRDKERAAYYRAGTWNRPSEEIFADIRETMRAFHAGERARREAERNTAEQWRYQRETASAARASTYFATVPEARAYIETTGAKVYHDVDDATGAPCWAVQTDLALKRGISDATLIAIAERLMSPEEKRRADVVRHTENLREELRRRRDAEFATGFGYTPPPDACPKCGSFRTMRGFFAVCPSCQS